MAQMTTPKPLENVVIIDFSRYLPGPYATLQLSQLGATVTVIQQPPNGDLLRMVPPIGPAGVSYASTAMERGKKIVLKDLRNKGDLDEALTLCDSADVVVESFRPGVAAKLGIDSDAIRARNKRAIYCSISGYGQDGAWSTIPGHDANFLAAAGVLDLNGAPDAPALPAVPIADLSGGSIAATAICAALLQRERTGVGTTIDVSLAEAALALQAHQLSMAHTNPTRGTGVLTGGAACYRPYQCSDERWIMVAAIEAKFFDRICELIERPDLVPLHFAVDKQQELARELTTIFATRSADEWADLLETEDTCVSKIATLSEASAHPQLVQRGAIETLTSQGDAPAPASPFVFNGIRF